VFLGHHLIDPDMGIVGDRLDDALEQFTLETLGLEDLADLRPFQEWNGIDMPVLAFPFTQIQIAFGDGRGVGHGPHRDRLGEGSGHAGGKDDARVAGGGRHAQDDPEHVHQSVLAAEDHVG